MRRPTGWTEPARVRFVVICHACQDAWEPDLERLDPGELVGTGCRRCGGWTWLGEISEPEGIGQMPGLRGPGGGPGGGRL